MFALQTDNHKVRVHNNFMMLKEEFQYNFK